MFLNVKRLSFEIEYLRNEITVDHLRVITVKLKVNAFAKPGDSHDDKKLGKQNQLSLLPLPGLVRGVR